MSPVNSHEREREIEALRLQIKELQEALLFSKINRDNTILPAEKEWQTTFDAISDPICILDDSSRITRYNKAFSEFVKKDTKDIEGKLCCNVIHEQIHVSKEECPYFRSLKTKKREVSMLHLNGAYYEIIIDPIIDNEGNFVGGVHIFKNFSKQKEAEEALHNSNQRMESLLKIVQHESKSIQEFLDYALNEAIKLTGSEIGYIYFYDESKQQFTLNSWSKEVMHQCSITNPDTNYELCKTGIWGEAVRQRKSIIINNYDDYHPLKKGYPEGHARLKTFMTIPLFKGDQIVSVIGLANKPGNYTDTDEIQLTLLMDSTWKVVERMRADEAMHKSEENFRSTMDNSPFGIRIINSNNRTIYANKIVQDVFGFKSIEQFNEPHPSERYTLESYNEHVNRKEKRKKGEYTTPEYDISIIRDNGEIRHLHVIRKEVTWNNERFHQVVYQDITLHKKAQENIIKLSRVTEQSPESILITDTSGKIEYVNPKFSELTGYSIEELIGQNPRVLKSNMQTPDYYANLWKTILSGQDWHGELHNKKKNGEYYWEKAIISPIFNEAGKVTHFVALKEDITERKKILAELLEAKEKAEESDKLKSAFLANLSHEIRTPMNAIIGFTDLLADSDLPPEKRDNYISIIQKSGNHLLSIIGDIIEISRIETGNISLTITSVNIDTMLEDLYNEINVTLPPEKQLLLKIQAPLKPLNYLIKADEVKLRQILTNLITNALKFTKEGHVSYGYNLTDSKKIVFSVADTGIGISKDYHQVIFERFRQVEGDDAIKHGGSGLGLAISKAYVEKMGGSIQLESEIGKGSIFTFKIPMIKGELIKPEKEKKEKIPTQQIIPGNELILIAEDNEDNYKYLEELFAGTNYQTVRAPNGLQAVEICKKNKEIKLILMDIKMPKLNGFDALKKIREFNPSIPIIAQTAYALTDDEQNIINAGFNGYLPKPIKQQTLLDMIASILRE